uniref:Uncharacterized protein n=1 Tax=Timema bartmani TaxID=61472 RepID=A0A7R9F2Q9_9NEOP|nr:unnamed protein product [Timema bartmani]
MIMRSLESQGLSDPSNVLLKYLEDWKTQFVPDEGLIDYNMIKSCVMKWLDHWMDTLKYHVEQVVKQLEQGQVTTVADMFLIQELDRFVERHQSKMATVVSGLTMETSELSKQSVEVHKVGRVMKLLSWQKPALGSFQGKF